MEILSDWPNLLSSIIQMKVPRGMHGLKRSTTQTALPICFSRPNSTVPVVVLTEERGRKLTPWLRAMKEIRQHGTNPPDLPRAELTPKRMSESHYTARLPFSTDEVYLRHTTDIFRPFLTNTSMRSNKYALAS
jgi:hypothetical protein